MSITELLTLAFGVPFGLYLAVRIGTAAYFASRKDYERKLHEHPTPR